MLGPSSGGRLAPYPLPRRPRARQPWPGRRFGHLLVLVAVALLALVGSGATPARSTARPLAAPTLSAHAPALEPSGGAGAPLGPTAGPAARETPLALVGGQTPAAAVRGAGPSATAVGPGSPAPTPPAGPTSSPAPTPGVRPPTKTGPANPPAVSAQYVAVVDGATGALLYGKNPHGRVAPASVTKIATAIVALEHARPDERVAISVDARLMPESTVMGLEPGENLSLLTLLYGLMLPSGNDAALAIAQHVGGGSVERFVQMMNDKARALGLENTHFANPHGLDAPDHYSSPFDMVQFARYGMRNAEFAQLAAAKSWAGEGYRLSNLNRLLWSYPGADGVKVGYTDEAGKTIVATATRDGHRVYVGLMRSLDLVSDCTLLLDYAFENFTW